VISVLRLRTVAVVAVGLGAIACHDQGDLALDAAPQPSASIAPPPSAVPEAAPPAPPAPPVGSVMRLEGGPAARVVFVDQDHHCPCNAEQIDSAWTIVDRARHRHPGLLVERVHADLDREREAKMRSVSNFWTFPAIYVFDARGQLVALLQGRLSEASITDALR
jgi:hypothetical protein